MFCVGSLFDGVETGRLLREGFLDTFHKGKELGETGIVKLDGLLRGCVMEGTSAPSSSTASSSKGAQESTSCMSVISSTGWT